VIDFWHIALSYTGPSAIVGDCGRRIVIPLRPHHLTAHEQAIRRSAEVARRLVKQFNGPTRIKETEFYER
jgi:hypothetical protein